MRKRVRIIWRNIVGLRETKKEANAAFDLFVGTYGVKYERAVKKLTKDRDVLLTFSDFPAEHWKHIRTTNPIESVFATVRNRTRKTKAENAGGILHHVAAGSSGCRQADLPVLLGSSFLTEGGIEARGFIWSGSSRCSY
jgi:hypothetical protein